MKINNMPFEELVDDRQLEAIRGGYLIVGGSYGGSSSQGIQAYWRQYFGLDKGVMFPPIRWNGQPIRRVIVRSFGRL